MCERLDKRASFRLSQVTLNLFGPKLIAEKEVFTVLMEILVHFRRLKMETLSASRKVLYLQVKKNTDILMFHHS